MFSLYGLHLVEYRITENNALLLKNSVVLILCIQLNSLAEAGIIGWQTYHLDDPG